ncbi:MAG: AMP-binding protein [Cycloclasticus sp.]|nr:AMP-binding protein [Cycloclasticus sp.]
MFSQIKMVAKQAGNNVALMGDAHSYSYNELVSSVEKLAEQLKPFKHQVVALYIDNCPEWIVIDLACQMADIKLLPLPAFFSDLQLKHAVKEAGAKAVIHLQGDRLPDVLELQYNSDIYRKFTISTMVINLSKLPDQTAKITFTSGSTGEPKGACLSNQQQLSVATSLQSMVSLKANKHLALLPFSTLLENVAGVYLTLLSGGSVLALSQQTLGFNGSSGLDIKTLLRTIDTHQPSSLILLPELLLVLVKSIENGWQPPPSLEFIAVGGSKVSPVLLNRAKQLGLPVYEGYGLSECSSVVSLNTKVKEKIGSVGKPLKHVSIKVDGGEIFISGNTFLGYVNQPGTWNQKLLATGDIGHVDDDGYLYIDGRKKSLLISSFGRNINPEWVESCLLSNGLLKQCVVFGDSKPFCTALLYPFNTSASVDEIQQCVDSNNATLPDYAQIKKWHLLSHPLTVGSGLLTANGRPKRVAIQGFYQSELAALYGSELMAL